MRSYCNANNGAVFWPTRYILCNSFHYRQIEFLSTTKTVTATHGYFMSVEKFSTAASYLVRALISSCDGHKVHDGHRHRLSEQRDIKLASEVLARAIEVYDDYFEPCLVSHCVRPGVTQRHRTCQDERQYHNHISIPQYIYSHHRHSAYVRRTCTSHSVAMIADIFVCYKFIMHCVKF